MNKMKEDLKQHRSKLMSLLVKCKEDIKKSQTSDGVDLIVNDYFIQAQKHLMALGLHVSWFLENMASAIRTAKRGLPVSSGMAIEGEG